jgi:cell wall-associated NlpC family hydrolase
MDHARGKFVEAIISRVGYPYVHGSVGPWSFDMCGLIEYGLFSSGIDIGRKNGSIKPADLYGIYHNKKVLEPAAQPGSLWLYSNTQDAEKITHVMVMIRKWGKGGTLVGSRGGGSTTVNETAAWEHRAFVDVVMTDYWHGNLMFVVDPFLEAKKI